jgi:hypothetical protein
MMRKPTLKARSSVKMDDPVDVSQAARAPDNANRPFESTLKRRPKLSAAVYNPIDDIIRKVYEEKLKEKAALDN